MSVGQRVRDCEEEALSTGEGEDDEDDGALPRDEPANMEVDARATAGCPLDGAGDWLCLSGPID